MNADFEKMSKLYSCVRELDKIIMMINENKKENYLDDAYTAIKEINKDEIKVDHQLVIVETLRKSIIEIYEKESLNITNILGITEAENESNVKVVSSNNTIDLKPLLEAASNRINE